MNFNRSTSTAYGKLCIYREPGGWVIRQEFGAGSVDKPQISVWALPGSATGPK